MKQTRRIRRVLALVLIMIMVVAFAAPAMAKGGDHSGKHGGNTHGGGHTHGGGNTHGHDHHHNHCGCNDDNDDNNGNNGDDNPTPSVNNEPRRGPLSLMREREIPLAAPVVEEEEIPLGVPMTGDASTALYGVLALVLAHGLAAIAIVKRRKTA